MEEMPLRIGKYVFDNEWKQARERLAHLERILDPATKDHISRLGPIGGWRCLEAGAGGGSITEWLSEQVGPSGSVVATDINTRFLQAVSADNVEVRQHDITREDLPEGEYDLVHCRALLMWLPGQETALRKLISAARPGGWVLIEEPDHVTFAPSPGNPEEQNRLFKRLLQCIFTVFESSGADLYLGARLPGMLAAAGLEEVGAEGRAVEFRGGSAESRFGKVSMEQLRPAILAQGMLTEDEFVRAVALYDEPSFLMRWFLTVSAWGRKPE
jgi:SAM-dependent methyltransferase